MNLNEYLEEQFEEFSLPVIKETKSKHDLYADYVELMAVFNSNQYISENDFLERFNPLLQSESENEDLEIPESDEIGSIESERDDSNELWGNNVFEIISEREYQFGETYPFENDANGIKLKNNLSDINKLYLGLLLASSLNSLKKMKTFLTNEFEIISLEALRSYLPVRAVLKSFGKNSDYRGTARDKIQALARDMRISVKEDGIGEIDPRNTQEEGLDIIGWIPFIDGIPNMITVMGQCACGKEWIKKQNETERYENSFFEFLRLPPIHSMFIPYALGNTDRKFYRSKDISKRLIFDRKRLIDCLEKNTFYSRLDTYQIVEYAITVQEEIV